MMPGRQRREVYYSGMVQGVGFRYTTRNLARGRDIGGFVRNLRDGRVQVVVEGADEEVREFLAAIRAAFGGYIQRVQQSEADPTGEFNGFDVRF